MRIGGVPYGVGAPLLTGLGAEPGVELVRDLPSRLIPRLRRGELDAALCSSIEAFRRPGYRVAPGIGICCRGPVHSVRAFRRPGTGPIHSVAVDDASESSIALLKVLLRGPLRGRDDRDGDADRCTFERVPATLHPDRFPHDLVMLIGDCGLGADPGRRDVLDLGKLWHDWTGLPFVFAAWLIAPGADAQTIVPLLRAAQARGGPGSAALRDDGVYYGFGSAEARGLERFRAEASGLGLCEPDVRPMFLPDQGAPAAEPTVHGEAST